MITIPSPSLPSIKFAATSVAANAGNYTITISAGFGAQAKIANAPPLTYIYIDPCVTTSIRPKSFKDIVVVVGTSSNTSTSVNWTDAASLTAGFPPICGYYSFSTNLLGAIFPFNNATFS